MPPTENYKRKFVNWIVAQFKQSDRTLVQGCRTKPCLSFLPFKVEPEIESISFFCINFLMKPEKQMGEKKLKGFFVAEFC